MKDFVKLIETYKKNPVLSSKKLEFLGVKNGFDAYNPSVSFDFEGEEFIFARVEKRKHWADSVVMLFKHIRGDKWMRVRRFKPIKLEDPFIKKIKGEFIFGGVRVKKFIFGKIQFKTIFFKGKTPFSLKPFAEGPLGMKDIRIVELSDEKIGVFTRPKGEKFGRGKIGFVIIDSVDDLKGVVLERAKLIGLPFFDGEWGGVNDLFSKGKNIMVLGHIAYSSRRKDKFYYPLSFYFNIDTLKISKLKVLFKRIDLPFYLPKRRSLYNVVFPGGMKFEKFNMVRIFVGVGDSISCEVFIKNPF